MARSQHFLSLLDYCTPLMILVLRSVQIVSKFDTGHCALRILIVVIHLSFVLSYAIPRRAKSCYLAVVTTHDQLGRCSVRLLSPLVGSSLCLELGTRH